MSQHHFLIIGAGIAGVCLSKQLMDAGAKVTLVDNGKNSSSSVAAGMINPMVFRRMTLSWRVNDFLPYAESFYNEFGALCGASFYHPIVIRRLFSSVQEREFWLNKQGLDLYENYLTPVEDSDTAYSKAINEFGSGRVKKASYISPSVFFEETLRWIGEQHEVLTEDVDYTQLNPETGSYKGVFYDNIIFCEGVAVKNNPWFGHVPINPTKGETMTIQTDELPTDESLNRKCFVLPLGGNRFRVGATYVWNTDDSISTPEGEQELRQQLAYLTNVSYDVVERHAGVRPTMLDRRPVMGKHSVFEKLIIFNGLGTKGYLLAPLLSKELVAFMLNGIPLDKEVLVERFALV